MTGTKTAKTRKAFAIKKHPDVQRKLMDAIWMCKIGNFNYTEALAYINSGELGYFDQSDEEKKNNQHVPITIGQTTYYEYVKLVESPEYQTKEAFRIFREEYLAEIIKRFKLFQQLEAKSFKALEAEGDPHKQQLIINGIFRNSPYTTSLMDIIKKIIEKNKMPFPDNPEVKKILEQEKKSQ